ncbi:MAG: hypothetical protein LQ351_007843 [Letrouitia transgressa]|nr:MAG: hypothetical protein LQ351_007843 [Letrouitia transgressa]
MGFSLPWSPRRIDNTTAPGSTDEESKERAQTPASVGQVPNSPMHQPETSQRPGLDNLIKSAPSNLAYPPPYQQPGPSSSSGWNGPRPHHPAGFPPQQLSYPAPPFQVQQHYPPSPPLHAHPQNTPPPPYAQQPPLHQPYPHFPPIPETPGLLPRHDPPTRVIYHLQGTLKYWPTAPLPPPPPSVWTLYEPPGTYGPFQGGSVVPQYMLPPPDLRDYDMSWLCAIRCLPAWTRSVEEQHWNQVRRNRNLIAMGMPPEQGKDECCLM